MQKQSEEKFKNLAITDELTGLYNRHFLEWNELGGNGTFRSQ